MLMSALSQYVLEKTQAKTGLSTNVIVGYALQAAFGVGSAILFFVALFFVFSDYFGFGGTTTSIGMFLMFVLLLVSAMLWTISAKKKTIAEAERAIEGHSFVNLNAPLLNAGLQLGQKVGWRRAVPALLALFAASGVAAEWSRRRHHRDDPSY
jgi:uncharacterized membrane protein YbhN (UPF0104 family)